MTGRFAPAKIIVIHRRKIIVHQREGVNEFYRTGRSVQNIFTDTKSMSRCVDESRPVTFACANAGIAHCLMQEGGRDCCAGDEALKAAVDALAPSWPTVTQVRGLTHASSSSEDVS